MIALSFGFIALTIFVVLDPLSKIDREFSEEVQEHTYRWLDAVMHGISWFGYMPNSAITVGVAVVIFLIAKLWREALFTLLTSLSGLVSTLIKIAIHRPRPQPSLVRVIEKTQQQSFPSGHVFFYTVFFGFIALLMYRLTNINKLMRWLVGLLCLALIFLVPLSRVYLGAHWFTDVLGGGFIGLIFLYCLSFFYLKLNKGI